MIAHHNFYFKQVLSILTFGRVRVSDAPSGPTVCEEEAKQSKERREERILSDTITWQ